MGKTVDMGSLSTRNEKVRAVGNMRVNARGDLLDNNNRVIQDATKRVGEQYASTVSTETKVKTAQRQTPTTPVNLEELNTYEKEFEDSDEEIKKS